MHNDLSKRCEIRALLAHHIGLVAEDMRKPVKPEDALEIADWVLKGIVVALDKGPEHVTLQPWPRHCGRSECVACNPSTEVSP
jgi:hypothetical protein